MNEFVINHFTALETIKHFIIIIFGAIGGGLFVILVSAFYFTNAEYKGDVFDTNLYTDEDPKKIILPKAERLTYAGAVYTLLSIMFYHFFGRRIKNRKMGIREKRGKSMLLYTILIFVLTVGYSIYTSCYDIFSPDPKELTEFYLRNAGVEEPRIKELVENGFIVIQTGAD